MDLLKQTLDVEEQRDTLADRIEDLEVERDRLVDEAIEIEDGDEDSERFGEIEERVDGIESALVLCRGYREVLNRAIEEWEGTEIVLRELSGAETRSIAAKAQRRADRQELGEYTDRFHETLMLETCVVMTPLGCPDPEHIGDLPDRLFDWLVDRSNKLNTVGDFSLGNSSLREAMIERRGQ